jgi:hypothetical protein
MKLHYFDYGRTVAAKDCFFVAISIGSGRKGNPLIFGPQQPTANQDNVHRHARDQGLPFVSRLVAEAFNGVHTQLVATGQPLYENEYAQIHYMGRVLKVVEI